MPVSHTDPEVVVGPIGEGGEYESLVLDAPFFRERLAVTTVMKAWKATSGHARVEAVLEAKAAP